LAAFALATSTALVLAQAESADAHVTVSSPDAVPGGFGKLVFRVPSESETASTISVQVTLPVQTPFAFVSSKPVPGWTVATIEHKLAQPLEVEGFTLTKAVSTVTWTATKGQGLRPGEFDEFELSVGPFPKDAGRLSMPAVQRYSDGTKVAWDQPTPTGRTEPEHPAPTLDLAGATTSGTESSTSAGDASADDPVARWLGGVGMVLGAAGLVFAMLTRRRRPA
jgi:uncharacterized protein YcnI